MGIKENIEKKIKANAKKIIKEINAEYITYVQIWEEFHEAKKQENDWRKLYSDICCRQQLMLEDEEWLRAKCYFEASKAVAGFSRSAMTLAASFRPQRNNICLGQR